MLQHSAAQPARGAGESPELIEFPRDRASCYARWRNVFLCYGELPPGVDSIRNYRRWIEETVRANPGGIALLTVVGSASTPQANARDGLIQIFNDLWPHLIASAFVIEAKGFAAAAQRSLASAFVLVSGHRRRIKPCADLDDALVWISDRMADQGQPVASSTLSRQARAFLRHAKKPS